VRSRFRRVGDAKPVLKDKLRKYFSAKNNQSNSTFEAELRCPPINKFKSPNHDVRRLNFGGHYHVVLPPCSIQKCPPYERANFLISITTSGVRATQSVIQITGLAQKSKRQKNVSARVILPTTNHSPTCCDILLKSNKFKDFPPHIQPQF
jgi:hypothetical protein